MDTLLVRDTIAVRLLDGSSTLGLVLSQLIPAAIALGAAWLGYLLATRQSREQRKHDHLRNRITLFYSPMVGTLRHIHALSEFRATIDRAAGAEWSETVDRHLTANSDRVQASRQLVELFQPFGNQIDYNNAQLRDRILPLYERMLTTFTDNLWLAEPDTQLHFEALSNFVDLWNRHLVGALPPGVSEKLQASEAALGPLYKDLSAQLQRLTALVAAGRAT